MVQFVLALPLLRHGPTDAQRAVYQEPAAASATPPNNGVRRPDNCWPMRESPLRNDQGTDSSRSQSFCGRVETGRVDARWHAG
eukprot:3468526-Prymnesium_polylepis.1